MADRPYTLLSCAMSIDGFLDRAEGPRLVLSNDADLDRVDEVRAGCDAILIGAATVRNDNPRLVVRSASRRAQRVARGLAPTPAKVTLTERAKLSAEANFFVKGQTDKLVYCASASVDDARRRLAPLATVIDGGSTVQIGDVCENLHARGVRRLMVEGGQSVLTQFLTAGLADELQLVIAPFFVGDSSAPRLVHDGRFPWGPDRHASLAEIRQIGQVALVRYALSSRFSS
jgi:5-amino-6-(5-phosphoribosylamino)uracil reductase